MTSPELKKTALNSIHRQLGARMVDFLGWSMPVQYAGPIAEHMAVRTRAGVFDVSHMGELEVRGSAAEENLQRLTCNDVHRLAAGQCQYSALTTPEGTIVDDILIYCIARDHFFLCVNASNQDKDFSWILENTRGQADVINRSAEFSQLAVQGPRALEILLRLTHLPLEVMKYYGFARGQIAGVDAIVSRTGYTGEDGFEIYFDLKHSNSVWDRIMEAGRPAGIEPAGLAARNTLRLEAKMALYGNDIDETTTVLEADLGWICKLEKGAFIGRDALLKQKAEGVKRKLVGFEMTERGIARDHCPIRWNGCEVGLVTSGSHAPYLQKNIGLTYLPAGACALGTEIEVSIRGKESKAKIVPTPFYRKDRPTVGKKAS